MLTFFLNNKLKKMIQIVEKLPILIIICYNLSVLENCSYNTDIFLIPTMLYFGLNSEL